MMCFANKSELVKVFTNTCRKVPTYEEVRRGGQQSRLVGGRVGGWDVGAKEL